MISQPNKAVIIGGRMAFLSYLLLAFSDLLQPANSQISIQNGIMDEPDISCESHELGLRFRTQNPFTGHVFVRGHYNEEICHKDFVLNDQSGGIINLPFDKCGMRRKRSANPRGMAMSATVVVSFHRTFITKIDRAYHVECFYMEADKIITQNLHVSALTPNVLGNDPQPMPNCQYQVLAEGPNGQPVTFAKVGDSVYHKWTCLYSMPDMYCMLIHSCTVDDGEASIYEVLDQDGCARDPTIIDELKYISDLAAGTQSQVFKFADKPRVYFTCQVKLSLKFEDNGGICRKPDCRPQARRLRLKRRAAVASEEEITLTGGSSSSSSRRGDSGDFDLVASPILIVDIDDIPEGFRGQRQHHHRNHSSSDRNYPNGPGTGGSGADGYGSSSVLYHPNRGLIYPSDNNNRDSNSGGICLSEGAFAIVLSGILLVAVATSLVSAIYFMRQRIWK